MKPASSAASSEVRSGSAAAPASLSVTLEANETVFLVFGIAEVGLLR